MHATAERLHLPFGVFIQQLLTTQSATDAAILSVHGEGNINTYAHAFQFDQNGLIQGRKHFDLVFNQVKKIETLRKAGEEAVKAKKPVLVTEDDASLMAARP